MNNFLLLFISFFFSTIASHCTHPQNIIETEPYPPVNEQRSALASKPGAPAPRLLDSLQLINDLEFFASDSCEGRKPGTAGHGYAIKRIIGRMQSAGVDSFNSLEQPFVGQMLPGTDSGKNIIGFIKGTTFPDKYIVITAHFDHLGKNSNGAVYYGADDNASGLSCLLAMAKFFKQKPHPYSLIFAALDREETGLEGAYNFVHLIAKNVPLQNLKFNLNLDMIARSDNNEIFACGIRHYPSFKYAVTETQPKTAVKLLMGHDNGSPSNDWTKQSDHAAFHEKKIPFLYIGVEDHPDYHKTTDRFDKINYSKYIENCNMLVQLTMALRP